MFFRLKNKVMITCPKGLPPLLRKELLSEEFPVVEETTAGVMTEGTLEDTLRLNLFIRTGHHVLFLLRDFEATDAEDLYREISLMPWEDYIDEDGYISVTSSVDNPNINDARYANLKCKDAIVDRIKDRCGRRPDSGPDKDGVIVHLYWKGRRCSVYLDTSGESLSRRGYRKIPHRAPMQETLAAAVVMSTGWDGESHFINPMCGSGTLAVEAALLGLKKAPGLLRSNYGFMHLKGYDRSLWDELRREAKSKSRKYLNGRIIATDMSKEAVEAAKKNAATAGVEHIIEFGVCDYSETTVPDGGGVVVLNPEYGERMGNIERLEETYRGIGDYFKQRCGGFSGYIFTGNLGLAKKVGLRPRSRIQFFNGDIECRLLEYELYEGSKKKKGHASNFRSEEK